MGPDMVIAMVLAVGVTHAWETGTRRCQAAWTDARRRAEERGAARERARQQRDRVRRSRFATAWSTGPRDPLWWIYAAGWLIAATASATVAGVQGARAGAVAGARGGYRVGRDAGRRGASYRDAWRQWRSERDWIDTEQCARCGGYFSVADATVMPGFGRVCPDCVPQPTTDRDEPAPEPPQGSEPHRCRSCDRRFPRLELDQDGWCRECVDALSSARRGEPVWPCARCGQDVSPYHLGARSTPDRVLCVACSVAEREQEHEREQPQHEQQYHEATTSGEATPGRIYVDAERVDVQEETDKEESPPMSELMPANAGQVAGTGEGYTDTVATLAALSTLLGQAQVEVQNLGDMLTANSLDADTLGQINDLADHLDAAAPLAQNLHKHVESRHAPVADAVAGAGGSSNVANTPWYDQY